MTDSARPKTTNILLVHYSQSGQLSRVAERFTGPLRQSAQVSVTDVCIEPDQPFPFPWPFLRFFDTFPETVYLDPPPIKPSSLEPDANFDLIIIAYQVWFLSPSLPVTAFMQSEHTWRLLKGKPVITLIACRNMWLMAQEEMKTLLQQANARLIGNVALVDEAGSIGSFLATPIWVLTGNKGPRLGGLIPRAGVAESEIESCDRFGRRILDRLQRGTPLDESLLRGLGAVVVDEKLISSEKTARRSFRLWGRLLRRLGPPGSTARRLGLLFYILFLVTFIVTFVPLSMLLKKLLGPVTRQRTARQKAYFGQPSGA